MKERPILFSGPMVRAILDGRKTVTRRAIKVQPHSAGSWVRQGLAWMFPNVCPHISVNCPYGQPGDRLWVRETWSTLSIFDSFKPSEMDKDYLGTIRYMASGWRSGKLRPSIFMPRWACRILLEITDVRVERLNDITWEQAVAEGISMDGEGMFHVEEGRHLAADPRDSFQGLWESINGDGSWAANPWCWAVSFKRVEVANADQ